MTTAEVTVWVLVNEAGEYVAHDDADALAEQYEERVGELKEAGNTRRIKVTLTVPLPKPIEVTGTVTESAEVIEDMKAA